MQKLFYFIVYYRYKVVSCRSKKLGLELKTGFGFRAITGGNQNAGKKHFTNPPEKILETRSQGTSKRSEDQDQERYQ